MLSPNMQKICDNFFTLKEKGYSISEIAIMYGISPRSLYIHLGEIADVLECSREDLLQRVHSKHSKWSKRKIPVSQNHDFTNLALIIDETVQEIDGIIQLIQSKCFQTLGGLSDEV